MFHFRPRKKKICRSFFKFPEMIIFSHTFNIAYEKNLKLTLDIDRNINDLSALAEISPSLEVIDENVKRTAVTIAE